ncbi:hypothetical protein [Burkholderia vietnamiensis]|uniref:hypothetical protein n=1 Tax=Burkholderia vietnamiensis TaxID=60552 RepID=UPI001CF21429|nr:hypothetical protein [Burkholderia vietnamiensis]MCA8448966.1 hypothetical protein [Burkholderia vietnamiensis]
MIPYLRAPNPAQGPAPRPIARAVHGRARTVALVHALEPLDQAVHEAHWVTTLNRLLDLQTAERQCSTKTVWRSMDQMLDNVVRGWCDEAGLHIPARRRRRTEAERREQAHDLPLRPEGLALLRTLEKGHRTPDQRMFDALERHDHHALRRALDAGANVKARFVPDHYDDGRRHGCTRGYRDPVAFAGMPPVAFAVMEDDVQALRLLLARGASRKDALGVLGTAERQGIVLARVHGLLESLELTDAIDEARPVRSTARARL